MNKIKINFPKAEAEPVEILVHGPIGESFWSNDGITGKQLTDAINQVPAGRKITLGINSQGGAIGEGLAMFNAIKRRAADITARIDGYALSIASFFPLAAGKVLSPKSSVWMIHKGWSFTQGNADEHRRAAEMLDKHDDVLVAGYVGKTGKADKEIRDALESETWMTGEEAVAFGLADEASDNPVALDDLDFAPAAKLQLKNFPKNLAPALAACLKLPDALAGAGTTTQPQPNPSAAPGQGGAKTNLMTKTAIVALLKKHGLEASESETEEQLHAKLAQIPVQPAQPDPLKAAGTLTPQNVIELDKIKAQLERQRVNQITRDLDQLVVDNKITAGEAKAFLPKVLADETILDVLRQREPVLPGAAPLGHVAGSARVTRQGLNDLLKTKGSHRAQHEFLASNWNELKASYPLFPQAANTDSASGALTTTILSTGVMTTLQSTLAGLSCFLMNFAAGRIKRNVIEVPHVTAGGTSQSNPTNFEDTTNFVSTVTNIALTPAHIVAGAHLTNAEIQNGWQMSWFAKMKAAEMGIKIKALVNAIITTGNFTADALVSAAAAFGASDLKTLWGQLKKAPIKNIALDGSYYANFLPDDLQDFDVTKVGMPGWGVFAQDDYWTGATASTVGFACNPQAIGGAIGLPELAPNAPGAGNLSEEIITLESNGMQVANFMWFNPAGRVMWWTLECMAGFAKGDGTAGVLIKSS